MLVTPPSTAGNDPGDRCTYEIVDRPSGDSWAQWPLDAVIETVTTGKAVRFTIPEGHTARRIASAVHMAGRRRGLKGHVRITGRTVIAWMTAMGLCLALGLAATAEAGTNQAILDWQDNAVSEGSYRVERAPGSCSAGSVFTEIAVLPPNSITYQDAPLPGGQTFCWRVRIEAEGLFSDYSNSADLLIGGLPNPGDLPPTQLVVR